MAEERNYVRELQQREAEINKLKKENGDLRIKIWNLEKELKEKEAFIDILSSKR